MPYHVQYQCDWSSYHLSLSLFVSISFSHQSFSLRLLSPVDSMVSTKVQQSCCYLILLPLCFHYATFVVSDNVLYCVIKKNIISWYAFEIRRVLQNRLDGIEIQDTSIEKIVDQSKFIAINIHLFLCYYNGLNYGFERK